MGTAAQAVPQGKTIAGPDGKHIFFPAGTSDDDIAAAFGGGPASKPSLVAFTPAGSAFPLPSDSGPRKGASSIIDAGPTTRTGTMVEGMESNPAGQHVPTHGLRSVLQNFGAGAGDAVTGTYHMFDGKPDAPDPTAGMAPEQRLQYHADAVADQGERVVKDPVAAMASTVGGLVPGAIVGAGIHAATPVIAEGAASGLNAGGRLLKGAGALTSRIAVGAPAAADAMGADAGAALSRNRIAGLTRRSLQRKVASTVGPASEARDAILARSDAAPVDVAPLTQAPFDDISEVKTDPQTGAVQPGAMRRLNVTRKAIQQVQDPETGRVTDTPKDLNLTPQQMGQLQTNVYDMTDYQSPESTLSNQYTKGVGARLKGAINQAAPEAETATDNIHDLLGAQEHLKATTGAPPAATDLGLGKMAGHLYDAARLGGGTAAGAAMDLAGTGMMKAGGVLRRAISSSPVAPAPPTQGAPGPQFSLPVPEAPGPGPEDLDRGGFPQRPSVTTPVPMRTPLLEDKTGPYYHGTNHDATQGLTSQISQGVRDAIDDGETYGPTTGNPEDYRGVHTIDDHEIASMFGKRVFKVQPWGQQVLDPALSGAIIHKGGVAPGMATEVDERGIPGSPVAPAPANAHPGIPGPGARTRIQPSPLKPTSQQVLSDQPGFVPPKGTRPLIASPDGTVTPQPYPLPAPPAPAGLLESATGRAAPSGRPALLRQFRNQAGTAAVADTMDREGAVQAGREKLAATPEGLPEQAAVEPPVARPALTKAKAIPPAKSAPASAAPSTTRLPDPTDVDGWEHLVDEGKARYNTQTHSYDYTGPIRPKLTR